MKNLVALAMVLTAGCQREPQMQSANSHAQASQTLGSAEQQVVASPQAQVPRKEGPERSPGGPGGLLSIWHSGNATPDQKVEAANKLLLPGTSAKEVEQLLGHGVWSRRHGVHYEFYTNNGKLEGTPAGSFQEVSLDYPFSDGSVSLLFDDSSGDRKFVRAVFRKTVVAPQRTVEPGQ
jgi:hypothetical protein